VSICKGRFVLGGRFPRYKLGARDCGYKDSEGIAAPSTDNLTLLKPCQISQGHD
jgi:hypothetical protein